MSTIITKGKKISLNKIIICTDDYWLIVYSITRKIKWPFGLQWNPRLRFFSMFSSFFFFFFQPAIVDFVNCEQCICVLFTVPQIIFLTNFLLKMGPTTLFTHLKIISLQCFQFQFLVSAKISSIQTHPKCVIYYWQ